ncbi:MAG: DNA polymerase III subunit beta [SAR202 cluster bacterium]|nr:DNA polymerase III subunit beta [SAR202 cluster bacterium]|tara:strand:- start:1067 stop:2194 length:1128 start_codon:yes stop_codon:yes gene_type:complete
MKLQCTQENLDKALSNISRAVASRTTLPITQNVLLKANNGKLQLSATNLEMAINTWIGCEISDEGETTIPARIFTDLIKSYPNDNIDLNLNNNNNLIIKCGPYNSNLITQSSDEFPPIPESDSLDPTFTISPSSFNKLINSVIFSAAQDQSRPVLTGVKFSITNNILTLATADGFRLSIISFELANENIPEIDFIVPAKSLLEVSRILAFTKDDVSIFMTKASNQVIFKMDNYQLTTTLTQGNFPDFNSLIPDSNSTSCTIPKINFKSAVRSLGVLAKDGNGIIRLEISSSEQNQNLLMSSKTDELGENSVILEINSSGEDSKIAFNSKYLSDVLDVIDGENVILEINGDSNPGLIKPENNSEYIHIVMPMFVQW